MDHNSLSYRTYDLNARAADVGLDDAYGAAFHLLMKDYSQRKWKPEYADRLASKLDAMSWSDLLDLAEKQIRNAERSNNVPRQSEAA